MIGFIRETLQDVAQLMTHRHVDLSAIFGGRMRQRANDWLTTAFWV